MKARYLVRFDDICPTANWTIWKQVEQVLERHRVKPILAVVPDNRDPKLQVEPARPDFWEWLRAKQDEGWAIGLHGYQHLYATDRPGLLGVNRRSEFAGLPPDVQREKLQKALEIFRHHQVRPDVFVAPAHSFDTHTLAVLRDLGIRVISDGFWLAPRRWRDMIWVPQQMWQFRRMPFGVWTICYHHNRFSQRDIERLASDIARFAPAIISLNEAINMCRETASVADHAFSRLWQKALRLKIRLGGLLRRKEGIDGAP
ncbi:MAG: hypothetical protein C4335_00740 [Armatimonadota bacterium]